MQSNASLLLPRVFECSSAYILNFEHPACIWISNVLALLRFERISWTQPCYHFETSFEDILITVTRSSKLWYAHSKHCLYHFETWHLALFQSKHPTCFTSNNIIKIFSRQRGPRKYVFRFLWEILILNIYTRFWYDLRIIVTFIAYDSSHVNHDAFQFP